VPGLAFPPPPVPDPERLESHELLTRILHGSRTLGSSQPVYWDGSDTVGVTFESIFDALNDAVPPDRPGSGATGVTTRPYVRR
jgi:hypothetical protein